MKKNPAKSGKLRKYPLVIVEWEDASAHSDFGWMDVGEVKKLHAKGVPMVSAGVEILRDRKGMVLATALARFDGRVGNVFRIPSEFLRKRRVVGYINVPAIPGEEVKE